MQRQPHTYFNVSDRITFRGVCRISQGGAQLRFEAIFNHFHGKKSSQKIINKHEFFHGPFYNAALPLIYLNIDVMDT